MTQQCSATVLIVDDMPENLTVLSELLLSEYRVLATTSGRAALRIACEKPQPDLILLDVMMPDMDGFEVLSQLQAAPATADIPVIFVTAMDSAESEMHGLDVGAADYIAKPIVPAILLARVRTQLELKWVRDLMRDQNAWLEAEVQRRIAESDAVQLVGIRALANLAATRDQETGNHLRRTQGYVRELATRLRDHPRFQEQLSARFIDHLARSAPLHDIGKVGIPDAILTKPGPLTDEERAIMQTHSAIGAEAIQMAERDSVQPVDFLALAREIARSHHERWDGGGYPDGLVADAIPVSARLMAVADVFDALISRRVYKAAMSYDHARDIIASDRATHFDPDMVDAFLAGFDAFVVIAEHFKDE